ncbi:DUF2786 domain-containing protein [Castellaniella sp.]|uniref:DUF2786 domain-containing protein n=1 Tax=Castellaniella sp. TaxID=1955812 RepID=UPI002AFE5CF3|nr:DUF2786 domain-containing protein [Castellaniella sp.]
MNVDQALARIKKCMALSKSSNEHEAAAAMRQAAALMRKFNLEHASVLASQASEASAKSRTKSKPSQWEHGLVEAVSKQFRCKVIMARTPGRAFEWIFVGTNHSAEIAAYAFTVLLRQALHARAAFQDSLPKELGVGDKRRLGNRFCLGWALSVYSIIRKFSGDDPQEEDPAVRAYIDQKNIPKETPSKARSLNTNFNPVESYAFSRGVKSGSEARLHRGVGAHSEEQGLLL